MKERVTTRSAAGWQERFTKEFGIHFKDSSGELQFALAFIEEELGAAEKRGASQEASQILSLLPKDSEKHSKITNDVNGKFWDKGYNKALDILRSILRKRF